MKKTLIVTATAYVMATCAPAWAEPDFLKGATKEANKAKAAAEKEGDKAKADADKAKADADKAKADADKAKADADKAKADADKAKAAAATELDKAKVSTEKAADKAKKATEQTVGAGAAKAKGAADKVAAKAAEVKLPSGLIYTTIKAGDGPSPKATSTVKVHYHGTLADGKVFDSSVQRGQPAEFPLNGVIPCWTEGVQRMKLREKAKLVCPPSIAYGDRGSPPVIPPNSTLTFEVELLEIK